MRIKTYQMRDFIVLYFAINHQLTGYRSGSARGEQVRRLDPPTIYTRTALDLEERGLLKINRTNARRYEIVLTQLGRQIYANRPEDGPWSDNTFKEWWNAQ